jgi:hypothetical protein
MPPFRRRCERHPAHDGVSRDIPARRDGAPGWPPGWRAARFMGTTCLQASEDFWERCSAERSFLRDGRQAKKQAKRRSAGPTTPLVGSGEVEDKEADKVARVPPLSRGSGAPRVSALLATRHPHLATHLVAGAAEKRREGRQRPIVGLGSTCNFTGSNVIV